MADLSNQNGSPRDRGSADKYLTLSPLICG